MSNIIPHRFIKNPEKGRENGVATLNASKQLTTSQIPTWLQKALNPAGTWDASGGTYPTPTVAGQFWIISVAGTIEEVEYNLKDWLVWTGTEWFKVDNTDLVVSIDGRNGIVTLSDLYEAKNLNIQGHIASVTGNPHVVTQTEVGLGNVDNIKQQPYLRSSILKTENYTAQLTDDIIYIDCSINSQDVTITLPTVVGNAGKTLSFYRVDNTPMYKAIIKAFNSELIDDVKQIKFGSAFSSFILVSTGSMWRTLYMPRGTEIYRNLVRFEDIGKPYDYGYGVGVCHPSHLPSEYLELPGTYDRFSPEYGNYIDTKGNIAVYIPKYWIRFTTSLAHPVEIVPWDTFPDEATANAAGYYLLDGFRQGSNAKGIFIWKYKASKITDGAGYSCGSVKNGNPISTNSAHNPIADLTAVTLGNIHASAIDAVKAIDGVDGAKNPSSNYFVPTLQTFAILKYITLSIPKDAPYCAWKSTTKHYPLGCDNNALAATDDTSVVWISDGYSNCGKTGSANQLAKTTHNGQACGIADIAGLMYEIATGFTCIGTTKSITGATKANPCVITCASHGLSTGAIITISSVVGMTQLNDKNYQITKIDDNSFSLDGIDSSAYTDYASGGTIYTGTYYTKKANFDPTLYTSGNTLATDMWGATGVANWGEAITIPVRTDSGNNGIGQRWGNGTNLVLPSGTTGNDWKLINVLFPKDSNAISSSGTDQFGKDYYYCFYGRNECCPILFGYWGSTTGTGMLYVYLSDDRSGSSGYVSFRACRFGEV
jgi:hypothetical protein